MRLPASLFLVWACQTPPERPDLVLLYSSGVEGEIEPCG
jgi:hypothetical protein